jgi:hypothetical protein
MQKRTMVAFGVFAVLLVAVIGVSMRPEKGERRGEKPRPIAAMKAVELDRLEIESSKGKVKLGKQGGSWKVVEPVAYPADSSAVQSALDKLEQLQFGDLVSSAPARHEELEVTTGKGVHVVAGKGSATSADFILGKSLSGFTMLRPAASQDVWQAVGSLRYLFEKEPKDWRNRDILALSRDDIESLEVVTPAGRVEVARVAPAAAAGKDSGAGPPGGAGGDQWTLVKSEPTLADFDDSVPRDMVGSLTPLKANDFADGAKPEETGFATPSATLSVRLKGGKTAQVVVGQTKGDDYYVRSGDGNQVYLIRKYSAERLIRKPMDFRLKAMADVKADEVQRIEARSEGEIAVLVRDGKDWKAERPASLKPDSGKVSSLLSAFGRLTAQSIAGETSPQATGLDKPKGSVTLTLQSGSTVSVQIGALHNNNEDYYTKVSGKPDVFVLKKWSGDRFLKKPSDLGASDTRAASKP